MNNDLFIILLLLSRLPLYAYAIYKSVKYRKSVLLINSNWLGAVAFLGAVGAVVNNFTRSKTFITFIGFLFAFSLFMLAYTAKEVSNINKKESK